MKHLFSSVSFSIIFLSLAFTQIPWQPDPLFGTDGIVITDFPDAYDAFFSLAIQPDGKIVAGGVTEYGSTQKYVIARYLTDGTLDNTFNGTGSNVHNIGTDLLDVIYSIGLQDDGKIVAAGRSFNLDKPVFSAARYNADGTLDNTFSGDGKLTFDISLGSYGCEANEVVIQPDGKILIGGGAFYGTDLAFGSARFLSDGTPDNSYGGDGIVVTSIFDYAATEFGTGLLLLPDGKIIISGATFNTDLSDVDIAMIKYNADGTPDMTFGDDGIAKCNIAADYMACSALQEDGKIILAGFVEGFDGSSDQDCAIARFNSDGTPDYSFDGFGWRVIDLSPDYYDIINDVAVQEDGKILITGYRTVDFDYDLFVLRLNADGSNDSDFGDDGMLIVNESPTDIGLCLAIQTDGKIIAAGNTENDENTDMLMVRFTNEEEQQSIENNDLVSSINIFPNPAHDVLELQFNLQGDENISFWLMDIYGRNIKTFSQSEFYLKGENSIRFSLPENIAAGTYILVAGNDITKNGVPIIIE
ncbi:MAG: hypothetical protein ACHQFW_00455 [Chitinophagales bacterium]